MSKEKRLFGEDEAAQYTETPLPTLRFHRRKGKITPANIGGVWVYTQKQLDQYRRQGESKERPADVIGSADVAEILGTDITNVNYHTRVKNIPGQKIGSRYVYWRSDMERVANPGDYNMDGALVYLREHGVELARRTVWHHAKVGTLESNQGVDGIYFNKDQLDRFIASYLA